MNGWFGFWMFCSVVVVCVLVEEIMKYSRERWIVKMGYTYNPEKKCWTKEVKND